MNRTALPLLLVLLAACSAPAAPPAPPAGGPAATGPGAPAPEMPAPARLEEGDRWFVAVQPAERSEPYAERHRRRTGGGVLREEVAWGATFAEVAAARHGVVQSFGLTLDSRGLGVALLGPDGTPLGEPRLEVAAPFRAGNSWETSVSPAAPKIVGVVETVEEVETPGGRVRALRVSHRTLHGGLQVMTTWYDAGLRPVRSEVRAGGAGGALLEARAALASPEPSPAEAKAAVEWALQHLAK